MCPFFIINILPLFLSFRIFRKKVEKWKKIRNVNRKCPPIIESTKSTYPYSSPSQDIWVLTYKKFRFNSEKHREENEQETYNNSKFCLYTVHNSQPHYDVITNVRINIKSPCMNINIHRWTHISFRNYSLLFKDNCKSKKWEINKRRNIPCKLNSRLNIVYKFFECQIFYTIIQPSL